MTAVSNGAVERGVTGVDVREAPLGNELYECGDWSLTNRLYVAGGV